MTPPSEYTRQRYLEAGRKLTASLQFAHDNVSRPEDKQTIERMLAYLKLKPGEASPAEIKFFNAQLNSFRKRGIMPDLLEIELRRRENVAQAKESPASANARVVSFRPTSDGKDKP